MKNRSGPWQSIMVAAVTALSTTLVTTWLPSLVTSTYSRLTQKPIMIIQVERDYQPVSGVMFTATRPTGVEVELLASGITDKYGIAQLNPVCLGSIIVMATLREGSVERTYIKVHEIELLPYNFVLDVNTDFSKDLTQVVSIAPAPVPVYPECGGVIKMPGDNEFLLFNWTPVQAASSYTFEADCLGCDQTDGWYSLSGSPWHIRRELGVRTLTSPIYSSMLHIDSGGHPLRWRVWAVDSDGKEGEKSNWCQIAFYGNY